MATTGNAQEFGTLTQTTRISASATDGRSGFTMAGANPSNNNVIQRFDMASLGNMVDYSDINVSKADNKGACGSHDGIDYDGLHPQLPSVTYMPGSGRTLIFGGILVGCFLPWTQPYVKEGFDFLNANTPSWFANCLYISIGASFGYRFGKQGLQIMNNRKQ